MNNSEIHRYEYTPAIAMAATTLPLVLVGINGNVKTAVVVVAWVVAQVAVPWC